MYLIHNTATQAYFTRWGDWSLRVSDAMQFDTEQEANKYNEELINTPTAVVPARDHLFYEVPECNLPRLEELIAKLNKRARKLGTPEIVMENHGLALTQHACIDERDGSTTWFNNIDRLREWYTPTGRVRHWHRIQVLGDAPRFEGWELLGTLEPVETTDGWENMLRTVPGKSIPQRYRTLVHICEHCNTKRRRKETFVVQHEDGRVVCVGRQCLKDFLGHTNPNTLARSAEYLAELADALGNCEDESFGGGWGHVQPTFDLETVLTTTAFMVRKYGWCSKGAAQWDEKKTSTAGRVEYLLDPPTFTGRHAKEDRRKWEQEQSECREMTSDPTLVQRVRDAIEWARSNNDTDNDYLSNLALACRMLTIKVKHFGIVCSLLGAYDRHLGVVQEREEKAQRTNEHFGTVGDNVLLTLTIERTTTLENMWGCSVLHVMRDEQGRSFKWFASGTGVLGDVETTVRIKAKIKGHDEYKGTKQTTLSHVSEYTPTIELTEAMVELVGWGERECEQLKNRRRFEVTQDDLNQLRQTAATLNGKGKSILARVDKVVI